MSKADIVNEWFRTRLASGPIAQNTAAYNQLVAALPELIETLDVPDAPASAARRATAAPATPETPADPDPVAAPETPAA